MGRRKIRSNLTRDAHPYSHAPQDRPAKPAHLDAGRTHAPCHARSGPVARQSAAGLALAALLTRGDGAVLATPYGRLLTTKLILFAGLITLATLNKLWLTPALLVGQRSAADRLRLSIRIEAAAIVAILATTAMLTTSTGPPAP